MPRPEPPSPAALTVPARYLLGAFSALAAVSACEIPTDLPQIETRWIVPAEETRVRVDDFLPAEVTFSADSTELLVAIDPVTFSTTLGALCAACAAADGLTVPKPAFSGTVESQADLPADIFSVTVASGSVSLAVENLFGFDPLRPAAGAEGTMTLRVTDSTDGDVLAELVLDGAGTSFPSGTTLVRTLALTPTVLDGALLASVLLTSPTGDPVTVDAGALLGVVATPSDVRVSEVSADVSNEPVTFDPVDLDVEDVDAEIEDAVVEGAFLLNVSNPFGVGADFSITIDGPTMSPLLRSGVIAPDPESTVELQFTGDELRSFLGEPGVVLTGNADVSATAGVITVRPSDELVLDADLDITLLLNGEDN